MKKVKFKLKHTEIEELYRLFKALVEATESQNFKLKDAKYLDQYIDQRLRNEAISEILSKCWSKVSNKRVKRSADLTLNEMEALAFYRISNPIKLDGLLGTIVNSMNSQIHQEVIINL